MSGYATGDVDSPCDRVIEALISAMAEAQSHASSSEPFESEDL